LVSKSNELPGKHWERLSLHNKDEIALLNRALDFEEKYFGDMTLSDFEDELSGVEWDIDGERVKDSGDIKSEQGITIEEWRFIIVKNSENYEGQCDSRSHAINISEKYKNDDTVLLHEMIHAYEGMLWQHIFFFQYVLIKLYKKLSEQVSKIDELIMFDQHVVNQVHSPLFCLKSFDLDLRLNQKLGTIYGYGREDMFNSDKG
jgi:predicted membrane GTPase involved in stress response